MTVQALRPLAPAAPPVPAPWPPPLPAELAIIVPTYNERANVGLLIAAVAAALPGVRWELLFVDDDSPDGTAAAARDAAQADPRVRVLHRYRRRGLSSACVEGIMATSAPFVAVIDGDLQHDEAILGPMLARLRAGDIDLVVGSRYVAGGGTGAWSAGRRRMSRLATFAAHRLARTDLSDPMSGFFMLTRGAFMAALPRLSAMGFKLLLDIAASAPVPLRVAELPYTFRARRLGESKLDALVLWEYLQLLADKAVGHVVPARFLSFAAVGGTGVAVHLLVLTLVLEALLRLCPAQPEAALFPMAQGVATLVATSSNFFLNNLLTYRDQRLRGRRLARGWLSFNLVCAVGFAANVGIARWLYAHHEYLLVSALAGIAVTTVWNYAMSSAFTWRKR